MTALDRLRMDGTITFQEWKAVKDNFPSDPNIRWTAEEVSRKIRTYAFRVHPRDRSAFGRGLTTRKKV